MKLLGFNAFFMISALIGWNQPVSAADFLPRPIFLDHDFSVQTRAIATHLSRSPMHLWIYHEAIETCKLSPEQAKGKIDFILDQESAVWSALDAIFPDNRHQIEGLHLTLVIDDFSSFAGKYPEFSSYYYRSAFTGPMIGIDCSSLITQNYWLPSLTHELTHALLNDQRVDSWWEEGLAQHLEEQVGGVQPLLTRGKFQKEKSIPNLLETRRPLKSQANYAISSLFIRYLRHTFGIEVLRAMSTASVEISNLRNEDWLSQAIKIAAVKNGANDFDLSPKILSSDHFSREDLLRYFYVALTMNNHHVSKYKIPGWDGFDQIPDQPLSGNLSAGQAMTISSEKLISNLNDIGSNIESYRIVLFENGEYQIFPKEEVRNSSEVINTRLNHSKVKIKLDYSLLINTSFKEQKIMH